MPFNHSGNTQKNRTIKTKPIQLHAFVNPGEGFLPEMTEGVMTVPDGTQVVISRGLGDSRKIPRINNQPELVVADICWY